MDNTKCKYLKPTFGFMLCAEYEHQTHCCDIKDCYFKQSSAYQQQYTAVVAQNKSLQGELNVYKATARIMAERIKKDNQYADRLDRIIRVFRGQALQELEAEND